MSNLPLGTAARLGNLHSRVGKALLKTYPFQTLLSLLETLPAESGESVSDPSPPLGATAPLGVSLGSYKSNPARVLLPARGPLRDHSVVSRLTHGRPGTSGKHGTSRRNPEKCVRRKSRQSAVREHG